MSGPSWEVTDDSPHEAPDAEKDGLDLGLIEEVIVRNAKPVILPNKEKVPLQFDIYQLHLKSVGPGVPMKYDATMTNLKPPGDIRSDGTFGPWVSEEPSDTPLLPESIFSKMPILGFSKQLRGFSLERHL